MRQQHLTTETVLNIIHLYQDNELGTNDISKQLNIHYHIINSILNKKGLIEERYKKALETYKEIKSITKTCELYNITARTSFANYIKQNGIEVINYQNLPKCDIDKFEVIDTEEKAYWLGFLYADGHIDSKDKQVQLALKESDYQHIAKFRDFMSCSNSITYKTNEKGNSYRISMGNQKLANDLISKGCVQRKSLILKFPSYDIVPKSLMIHFLRGYFDGDGYLGIKVNKHYLTPRCAIVGTEDFITGFSNALGITLCEHKLRPQGRAYQYEFFKKECEGMLFKFYENCNVYLDRKHDLYLKLREYIIE